MNEIRLTAAINLRVTQDMCDELRALAERHGVSVGTEVRRAIRAHLIAAGEDREDEHAA